MYYFFQMLSAFFATFFFSMLFQVARKTLLLAGICGAFGWLCYIISIEIAGSLFYSSFLAALIVGVISKAFSVWFRIPVPNLLISGIITIVPGGAIYMAMSNVAANNMNGFLNEAKNTLIAGGGIALAIFIESTAFEKLPQKYYRLIKSTRRLWRNQAKEEQPFEVQEIKQVVHAEDYHRILKTSALAGKILLRSGAEVFKVEDIMNIICKASGISEVESFATPTGILISVEREDGEPLTSINRISSRSINLKKIAEVDRVVSEYLKGDLTLQTLKISLEGVEKISSYHPALRILAGGLVAAFFSVLFKGDLWDLIGCLIVGCGAEAAVIYFRRNNMPEVITYILGGVTLAFLEIAIGKAIPNHFDIVIMSAIMIFVPGVAITNAIREAITGDYISSVSRAMEALVVAATIATGIGMVVRLVY